MNSDRISAFDKTAERVDARLAAWLKTLLLIDGIAVGSTIGALQAGGILDDLAATTAPLTAGELAAKHRLRPGYLHLALKLLCLIGLVRLEGDFPRGEMRVCLSTQGRKWLPMAPAYAASPALIEMAMAVPLAFAGGMVPGIAAVRGLAERPQALTPENPAGRVYLNLLGPVVAAVMRELRRYEVFARFAETPGKSQPLAGLPGERGANAFAFDLLADLGWAETANDTVSLTAEGVAAVQFSTQLFLTLGYLETFVRVPDMLFGRDTGDLAPDAQGRERHVDRALDIELSGAVFNKNCRGPFLELALPLFDKEDLQSQPRMVVDTGSGNGTLLKELFTAIRGRTRRGAALDEHPLLMVGAEFNEVARAATEKTLAEAGVPYLTLFGDIGDPQGLAVELGGHGLDAGEGLHVSKSVIHNRRYAPPRDAAAARDRTPGTSAVFVAPDGALIDARDMEQNLVELFAAWRPLIRRHGMIAIEAHTVAPEIAAAHVHRSLIVSLDASHGYSHQYPVEIEVFRQAAWEAGLITLGARDLNTEVVGRPIMSIDHFLPMDAAAGEIPAHAMGVA